MTRFYKIKTCNYDKPFYVYSDKYYKFRNFLGGYFDEEDAEIVEIFGDCNEDEFIAKHRKDIYSFLIDDTSDYGWLSPNCEWFPCEYGTHTKMAMNYFGMSEVELEESGYVKVYRNIVTNKISYLYRQSINSMQKEWLENHCVAEDLY